MKSRQALITIHCMLLFCIAQQTTGLGSDLFESRIRPLLIKHCLECHNESTAESGLRLDIREGWARGGDRGPAIVPGNPGASLLIQAVRYSDPDLQMPPPDHGGRLQDEDIRALQMWIQEGAPDPRTGAVASHATPVLNADAHWSFQPIQRPEVPADRHPVDGLIEKRLTEQQFEVTPKADARTLARRLTINLTGLPPSADQIKQAETDLNSLIDELLASPRYGERWARHWLDVARYSDTKDGVLMYGDGRIRPFAYTYRDYVIRSLNDDKPYDQFVREQLAADQMGLPADAPELAALGFLTLGRMFDNNRHDVIDDQIDVVSRGLLGLTVSCSRCHDHKFDPVPTADYYSLYGVFARSVTPFERPRIEPVTPEGEQFEKDLATRIQAIRDMEQQQHALLTAEARRRTADYLIRVATTEPDVSETAIFFLSLLPEDLRPQIVNRWRRVIAARAQSSDLVFAPWFDLAVQNQFSQLETLIPQWRQRQVDERIVSAIEKNRPADLHSLARTYGDALVAAVDSSSNSAAPDSLASDPLVALMSGESSPAWFPVGQTYYYLSRHEKDKFGGMIHELDTFATQNPKAAARAMVLMDSPEPYQPVIFRRGDPTQPGDPVPRRFLRILSTDQSAVFTHGSGRLDLAVEITRGSNPLTPRVIVNRIWMHHFGEPLVEQPSDFGLRTERPVQHELLDFLADEFVRSGWKLKSLHKLILTSAAWQRSSLVPETDQFRQQLTQDPGNRLLWKAERRRLDMESMRDSMLAVSDRLDLTMYGRPQAIDDLANRRRSIYCLVERQSIPTIVRSFDVASADVSAARRVLTTVPQQALFAMNSPFVIDTATAIATGTEGQSDENRVQLLFRKILRRDPTGDELSASVEFSRTEGWNALTQSLLMTNEFLFVD